jgi:hypothetical protein
MTSGAPGIRTGGDQRRRVNRTKPHIEECALDHEGDMQ